MLLILVNTGSPHLGWFEKFSAHLAETVEYTDCISDGEALVILDH